MAEEKKSVGAAIGAVIAQVVLGVVCAVGAWIAHDMMPKKPAGPTPQMLAMAAAMNAPQTVAVTNAEMRVYNLPERIVAHAEAAQEVDLLPQVDGYVKEILFNEGDLVKEGQVLYVLDDERYQAVANLRRADVAAAEAEERRTRRMYDRMLKADERGVTELERDNAEAGWEKARAAVEQAKANLVVAEYDLKKAKVVAPISGQIGKTSAHIGDYVSPAKGPLSRIVQVDPIRVSFPITDRNYIAFRKAENDTGAPQFRTRILLADGSEYPFEGKFAFDDNEMSTDTATVILRLDFANPDRMLLPNSYVTVLSDSPNPPSYPSVPQTAIFDLPEGKVGVWVVDAENKVSTREIVTKDAFEGWSPCLSGLNEGETVVVSGVQKLQNGKSIVTAAATPVSASSAE